MRVRNKTGIPNTPDEMNDIPYHLQELGRSAHLTLMLDAINVAIDEDSEGMDFDEYIDIISPDGDIEETANVMLDTFTALGVSDALIEDMISPETSGDAMTDFSEFLIDSMGDDMTAEEVAYELHDLEDEEMLDWLTTANGKEGQKRTVTRRDGSKSGKKRTLKCYPIAINGNKKNKGCQYRPANKSNKGMGKRKKKGSGNKRDRHSTPAYLGDIRKATRRQKERDQEMQDSFDFEILPSEELEQMSNEELMEYKILIDSFIEEDEDEDILEDRIAKKIKASDCKMNQKLVRIYDPKTKRKKSVCRTPEGKRTRRMTAKERAGHKRAAKKHKVTASELLKREKTRRINGN